MKSRNLLLLTCTFVFNIVVAQKPLSDNVFTSIDDAQKDPEIVQMVDFHSLSLSELNQTFKYKNLLSIDLSMNQFTTFPEQIFFSPKLTTISFGGNQLEILPKRINEFTFLEHLNLENNNITTLPDEIGSLKNLQQISLYKNQLKITRSFLA